MDRQLLLNKVLEAGTKFDGHVTNGSASALADLITEEAQWWWDYTFGKPQSAKLGVERLQEAHYRILAVGGIASANI